MNTPRLDQLLREVEARLSERGSNAALAEHLGVDKTKVSQWLKGGYKPNGEMALALVEWLKATPKKSRSRRAKLKG